MKEIMRYELGSGLDEKSKKFIDQFGLEYYLKCKEKLK